MDKTKVNTSSTDNTATPPFYQQVKNHIQKRIENGEWAPGMKIHSESELVAVTGFSRMTVNRAVRELTAEGKVVRKQGKGTFVAARKSKSPLLEVQSIAHEIITRGGEHSCDVYLLQEEKARPELAKSMGLLPYTTVFHSVLVHKDAGIPIQLSSRFINPRIAPDYLSQDFTTITPNEYLLGLAPISAVEHVIEALIPEVWIRELLKINSAEPCLALSRKTWVDEEIATCSTFYYPGSRYTLGSKFIPGTAGTIQIS